VTEVELSKLSNGQLNDIIGKDLKKSRSLKIQWILKNIPFELSKEVLEERKNRMNRELVNKLFDSVMNAKRSNSRLQFMLYLIKEGLTVDEVLELRLSNISEGKIKGVDIKPIDTVAGDHLVKNSDAILDSDYLFPSKPKEGKATKTDKDNFAISVRTACRHADIPFNSLDIGLEYTKSKVVAKPTFSEALAILERCKKERAAK